MESGYFLEPTSSWKCREMSVDGGPSGSLPLLMFNTSTSVRCNRSSSSEWSSSALGNETKMAETLPQFNRLSLVKTIVLSTMFVVAFTGNQN